MSTLELIHAVPEVEKRLSDDLSKKIYEMRLKYSIYKNIDELLNSILNLNLEWQIPELDEMYRINNRIDNIIIFGAGVDGKYTLRLLKNSKYKNVDVLFCDNNPNKWGGAASKELGNLPVISPYELFKKYRNSIVIVGSSKNKLGIYGQLLWKYPVERILCPKRILYGKISPQYFDYFEPNEAESFIDGGAYDGKTAVEFTEWAKKGYDYIYSFEADPYSIKDCEDTFKEYNLKGELINKGLWNKTTILRFDGNKAAGSKIKESGSEKIEVTSIDETLKGKRISFIKMDIEGAEYNALIGAEQTIKKWHPRLAICVYHKLEDIFEIPSLLLSFNSEYKFALRQYSTIEHETVLYAY